MNRKITLLILVALVFLLISLSDAGSHITLAEGNTPVLTSAIGTAFTYQGSLKTGDQPANGLFDFKFELYDSLDIGTGALFGTVDRYEKQVSDGLFTIELDFGDVFDGREFWIEVSVRPSVGEEYTTLVPRQAVTATPYALYAQGGPWSAGDGLELVGTEFRGKGTAYQNLVIVAKSGGDFTSVQAAIDSITNAAANNPYLVWVAPGVYSELVIMKAYVHLQGAGQEATVITSSVSCSDPPTDGTLKLASNTSLRDLTVGNNGSGFNNVAVLATSGTSGTLVCDVTARAQGQGIASTNHNIGIYIAGADTEVTLQNITTLAENVETNIGLLNTSGAKTRLYGVSFTARGGDYTIGISNLSANLEALNIVALGANGFDDNIGLRSYGESNTILNGGSFTGRGGSSGIGVKNSEFANIAINNATMTGENGSLNSYGYYNSESLNAEINSSKITGSSYAIANFFGITYVGVTQLDGGAWNLGSLICFQVYDGGFNPYSCP